MQTSIPALRKVAVLVAFALTCVVVSVATWRSFGGTVPLQPRDYRVGVILPQASSLYAGSDVRVAGVSIGRVAEVRRHGGDAHVMLTVQSRYVPLHLGTRVMLRNKTLLGEGYLELALGSSTRPSIADGGEIPRSGVVPQQRLDDVLETFGPSTRRDVRSLFRQLATVVHGRAASGLSGSLGEMGSVSTHADATLAIVARQDRDVRSIVRNGGAILETLGERRGAVQAAVQAGAQVVRVTARQRHAVAATVSALPPFLHRLRTSSAALRSVSAPLGQAVLALDPVVPKVAPALDNVEAAAAEFRGTFRLLPTLTAAATVGLPGLRTTARSADSLMQRLYPSLREVVPLLQLFAVDRDSVVGGFANVSSLIEATSVDSSGASGHSIGGVLSAWNELPAGWVKKLPTNRSNAYPRPGSANDIAHGGLRAYDCRNTGNRLYLPPTGTGAPPCMEQGPWTYRGVTQQYPHLTRAPK